MKKLLVTAIVAIAIASCGKPTSYKVSGEVQGLTEGTKVYLDQLDPATGGFVTKDSTEVKANNFLFKGEVVNPDLSFVRFGDQEARVPFILENGDITLVYDVANMQATTVKGTENNTLFSEYNKTNDSLKKIILEYQSENQAAYMQAYEAKDEAAISAIIEKFEVLNSKQTEYTETFLQKNSTSFASLLLLPDLMRSGAYVKEEVVAMYDKYDEGYKNSTVAKAIKTSFDQVPDSPVKIGDKAPEFSANSPEGKAISLKESLGKITIIDFWASWCQPCRIENPNVVALYKKYHDKGLNIIGVSLDEDGDKWKEAIAKDMLTWNQISNLQGWKEEIAASYGVKSIPATFLVDDKGVVIARNLRGKKLEQKVEELLGK